MYQTFRNWCVQKWYEHCDEVLAWSGHNPEYRSREYFLKYRWWLRREYQSQIKKIK